MSKTKPALLPTTNAFRAWIEDHVRPLLLQRISRGRVSVMIDLLTWLEQQRYDFRAARAFQTRPLAMGRIADHFSVSTRTARRWFAELEDFGLIAREYSKNRRHRYKNLFNRIKFAAFFDWFKDKLMKTPVSDCPPNKTDLESKSINDENSDQKQKLAAFPASGSITYDKEWADLARSFLPSGRGRPCMNMVAQKFRQNLSQHGVKLDHPSVRKRWINFCKGAKPIPC